MAAGATYEPIATQTLISTSASISFTSIPATYTDIVAVFNGVSTSNVSLSLTFNNDTASNYSFSRLIGDGSAASSTQSANQANLQINSGNTSTDREVIILHIMNYSNTTTFKPVISRPGNAGQSTSLFSGLYRSTSAINRIDFSASPTTFAAGSTWTLYGIAVA
jgi:hypothetical protein